MLTALRNLFWPQRSLYQRGYDYVTEQLAKGRKREELEIEADNPFDANDFERGMNAALRGD